jgi:hypothetical protein
MGDLQELGARLSAEQLAGLFEGFEQAGGSIAGLVTCLNTKLCAQMLHALEQDYEARQSSSDAPPTQALAVATAAVVALKREDQLLVLDALGEELMSTQARHTLTRTRTMTLTVALTLTLT